MLLALFALDTRPLETNGGLGYDGVEYAAATSWLRGDASAALHAPWAYRILGPALVALSGLEARPGFFALNSAALLASSLVLLVLLRREGATPARSLLLVIWYALLPNGLRYALAYPVLVDGLGLLLFIALVAASALRRPLPFAILLVAGVLAREHVLLLAPLGTTARGGRGALQLAAIATPAVLVLLAARLAIPVAAGPSQVDLVGYNAAVLLLNFDGEAFRSAAAPLLTFGTLSSVLLARPGAVREVLRRPWWAYVAAVILIAGAVGGRDHDRYLVWLAPFLLLAAARIAWRPWAALALTVLQAIAARTLFPLDGSDAAYRSFALISMPLDVLARSGIVAAAAVAVGAIAIRPARATPSRRSAPDGGTRAKRP